MADKIKIKTGRQIDQMRAACATAASILDKLEALVKPGATTREIDLAAAALMSDAGCKSAFLGYRGFPGNICISVNEEVVHGIGGPRKIQYGDVVKIDVGVVREGWVGDNATTVAAGLVHPDVAKLLDVTEESLYLAIAEVREGRPLGDLCSAVQRHVESHGMSVVREFVGHGVGRKLHEEPQIPNYGRRGTGPRLRAGMTLAIEPMVNLGKCGVRVLDDGWTVITADRSPSAHFEHTVLVTTGEPEILTWREKTRSKLIAQ